MIPELIDLIHLLPSGASVIAVIVVVVLFLRQQDKMNDILKQVTDKFNDQTSSNQKAFQDQITNLSNQYYVNQKSFQDQIQVLIDNHLKVSERTVTALRGLEAVVRNIQDKVARLPDERNKAD